MLLPKLIRRFDKMKVNRVCLLLYVVLSVLTWAVGYGNVALYIIMFTIRSIPLAVVALEMFIFTPDCAEYGKFKSGIEAKGKAEAAATQAKLQAEAEGIRAKGDAEAEAMDKKSEAFKKSEFAKLEMVLDMQKAVLPQVAEHVAKPMGQIKDITIYGQNGSEVAGVSQNVPVVMKKTFDIVKDTTGVDLADVMKSETIDAKITKNVNLSGDMNLD